ncbi:ABC transporter permease [Pseudonocardia sp. NPDC049635]|uniref:ABC transporter permease n=1 Tax=Pseudonocardia sp. NPDC049635 TaxID=3155506 RepID=UPI0034046A58
MTGTQTLAAWPTAVAVVALTAVAVIAALVGSTGTARMSAWATCRAVVQLGAVAVVIVVVLRNGWTTAGFVLLMLGAATFTSGRRLTPERSGLLAGVSIGAGTAPVLGIVLATGAVPLTGVAIVPVAGIIIGGAMTATSLAGRRALAQLADRFGEYEAALALGLPPRDAALLVIRDAAHDSLVPALDQTRTVGLVTLPGAFVGVLLGSGDPVQAAAAQILVLAGLLAAETIAALVTVEMVARRLIGRTTPGHSGRR